MKLPIVAVRDSAVSAFARPMAVQSVGIAVRSFKDEVNRSDQGNALYMHPDDFELWQLGEFDEDSGALIAISPVCVARAKDMKVEDK